MLKGARDDPAIMHTAPETVALHTKEYISADKYLKCPISIHWRIIRVAEGLRDLC